MRQSSALKIITATSNCAELQFSQMSNEDVNTGPVFPRDCGGSDSNGNMI